METLKRILATLLFIPILYFGLTNNFYHALYFSIGVVLIGYFGYYELRLMLLKIGHTHTFLIPLGLATIYGSFFYHTYELLLSCIIVLFILEVSYWLLYEKDFSKIWGNILSGLFVLFYLGIFWGSTILLRQWNGREIFIEDKYVLGTIHFIVLIVATWMCDIGAYFGGRWFGKRKLNIPISPNKTLEGFVSGIILAIICTYGVTIMLGLPFRFSFIFLPFVGIIGDLFESLIKRVAGVKDSSHLIPGHGGILDIFDALIFTTPVYYFCILL